MSNIIIGGKGFIGTHWCQRLLDQGESIHVIDLPGSSHPFELVGSPDLIRYSYFDASDTELMLSTLQKERPNKVIHLAANSDIRASSTNAHLDFKNTLSTSLSLAQSLKFVDVDSVIFASSSAVYGTMSKKEFASEQNTFCNPISHYGAAKLASEFILKSQGLRVNRLLIGRFPNVIGRGLTHGVIYDLYNKLLNDRKSLTVLGNGNQTKPYMLANDLIESLEFALLQVHTDSNLTINISPNDQISVRQIAEYLVNQVGLDPKIISYGDSPFGWEGDVPNYQLSTELLDSLGWKGSLTSNSALIETVRALLEDSPWPLSA